MNSVQKNIVAILSAAFVAGVVHAGGPDTFQFGPTGLCGNEAKSAGKVTKVDKGLKTLFVTGQHRSLL